jgi:hypothetical protein
VEPGVEAAALEELVDEDPVAAGVAVPEQARQVRVAQATQRLQLGAELAVAGGAVSGEPLHRDGAAVGEHGAVHEPEAPVTDDVVRGEAAGRGGEVGERELRQRRVRRRPVEGPRRGVPLRGAGGGWSGHGELLPRRRAAARLDEALAAVAEEGEEEAGHRDGEGGHGGEDQRQDRALHGGDRRVLLLLVLAVTRVEQSRGRREVGQSTTSCSCLHGKTREGKSSMESTDSFPA